MSIISYRMASYGVVWVSLNADGEPSIQCTHGDGRYRIWGIINDPISAFNEIIISHHGAQLANQDMVSK